MQPHTHICKQNNNQNFAFYCIKHSKIDTKITHQKNFSFDVLLINPLKS